MNIQSTRRLLREQALRQRIKERLIASYRPQDMPDEDDNCPCTVCTVRRSMGLPRGVPIAVEEGSALQAVLDKLKDGPPGATH